MTAGAGTPPGTSENRSWAARLGDWCAEHVRGACGMRGASFSSVQAVQRACAARRRAGTNTLPGGAVICEYPECLGCPHAASIEAGLIPEALGIAIMKEEAVMKKEDAVPAEVAGSVAASGEETEETRRCSRCGETKPLAEFSYDNKGTGRRKQMCKACVKAYYREYARRRPPRGEKRGAKAAAVPGNGATPGAREETRRCSRCGETKPVSEFWYENKRTGLRKGMCTACIQAYRLEYARRHKKAGPVRPADRPDGPGDHDPNGLERHEPGAKFDAGKPRIGLMIGDFSRALVDVARVSTHGAAKYSDHGWRMVPDGVARYTDALYRHLLAERDGGGLDAESGLLHAAHAAWNALARLELMLSGGGRPPEEGGPCG